MKNAWIGPGNTAPNSPQRNISWYTLRGNAVKEHELELRLNEDTIKPMPHARFLGVRMDSKINWKEHMKTWSRTSTGSKDWGGAQESRRYRSEFVFQGGPDDFGQFSQLQSELDVGECCYDPYHHFYGGSLPRYLPDRGSIDSEPLVLLSQFQIMACGNGLRTCLSFYCLPSLGVFLDARSRYPKSQVRVQVQQQGACPLDLRCLSP